MMHGKAIWKLGINEIAKASRDIAPDPYKRVFAAPHMNDQLQGASMLMYVGVWPMTIKLNPSWKTEVSKSAWIKPCISMFKFHYYTMLKVDITEDSDVVYSSPPPPIYTGYTETLAAWSV